MRNRASKRGLSILVLVAFSLIIFSLVIADATGPPVITNIMTVPSLPLVNNGSEQALSVNFTSDEYPINVTFYLYNASLAQKDMQGPTRLNDNTSLPLTYTIPDTLDDGLFYLNMSTYDDALNTTVSEIGNFTVENAVSVVLDNPTNDSAIKTGAWLNLTINSGTSLDVVYYDNGTANFTNFVGSYDISTSGWTEAYTFVWIWANNTNGITNYTAFAFEFDDTPPVIELPFYTNRTWSTSNGQLTLNISINEDNPSVSNCTINITIPAGNIPYSNGWCNGTVTVPSLGQGDQWINVTYNDINGNTGWNNSLTTRIDNTQPTLELPFYTNATLRKFGDIVVFNISVSDSDSGISNECTVKIGGTEVAESPVSANGGWCNVSATVPNIGSTNYTVNVSIQDIVGMLGWNDSFVLDADNFAPFSMYDQANNTSPDPFEVVEFGVYWTDIGDADLSRYIFSWNASNSWVNDSDLAFSGAEGVWSNVTKTIDASLEGKIIGWQIWANDSLGNTYSSANNTMQTIVVNSDIPSVYTEIPTNQSLITQTNDIFITATDTGEINTTLWRWENSSDNGAWTALTQGTPSSNYTSSWDTSSLNDGEYWLHVFVNDSSGNQNDTYFLITTDNTGPTATIYQPSNNTNSSSDTVTLEYNATDIIDSSLIVWMNLDGTISEINGSFINATADTHSMSTLSQGDHRVNITVQDDVYQNTTSETYWFTVDTSEPAVKTNEPSAGYVVGTIDINATISDAYTELSATYFRWENSSGNGDWTILTFTDNFYISTLDTSNLLDGDYGIRFFANDTVDNINNTEYVNITVDNTVPTVVLDQPLNVSILNTGIQLNFSVSDNGVLETVYYDNGTGNFTNFVNTYDIDTTGWSEGDFWIWIWANDSVGNTNFTAFAFEFDDSPPNVTLHGPPNNSYLTTYMSPPPDIFRFNWSFTDPNDNIVSCYLLVNETSPPTSIYYTNSSTLNASFTNRTEGGMLGDNMYYWNVNCSDGVNYDLGEERNFTIDYATPTSYLPFYTNRTWVDVGGYLTLNISIYDATSGPAENCSVKLQDRFIGNISQSNGWCNGTVTIPVVQSGEYLVNVTVWDRAGWSHTNKSFTTRVNNSLPTSNSTSTSEWKTWGRDMGSTKYYPGNVNMTNFGLKWVFNTSYEATGSYPLISNGIVYVTNFDDDLYALDAYNGSVIWSNNSFSGSNFGQAIADGMIYAINHKTSSVQGLWDTHLTALDASNGTQLWDIYRTNGSYSNPLILDGILYVVERLTSPEVPYNDYLLALNSSTGNVLWNQSFNETSYSLVLDYERLYLRGDNITYGLNRSDGSQIWNYTFDKSISLPTLYHGMLYIVNNEYSRSDNSIYAINATNGTLIWNQTIGEQLSPPAVGKTVLYFSEIIAPSSSNLHIMNATTGSPITNYSFGYTVLNVIASDNVLFLGYVDASTPRYNKSIYAMNMGGSIVWSFETNDGMTPLEGIDFGGFIVDNYVYMLSRGGRMYAFTQLNDTVISNIIKSVNTTFADITWETNYPANRTLNYGTTTSLGTIESESDWKTNHTFSLTSLTDRVLYYYNITSCNTANLCTTEGPYNFTTEPIYDFILDCNMTTARSSALDMVGRDCVITNNGTLDDNYIMTVTNHTIHSFYGGWYYSYNGFGIYWEIIPPDYVWRLNQTFEQNISLGSAVYRTVYLKEYALGNYTLTLNISSLNDPRATRTVNLTYEIVPWNWTLAYGAYLFWGNQDPSNFTVNYGETTDLGNVTSNSTFLDNRTFEIWGLENNTIYFFNITSCNSTGSCIDFGIYNFTTVEPYYDLYALGGYQIISRISGSNSQSNYLLGGINISDPLLNEGSLIDNYSVGIINYHGVYNWTVEQSRYENVKPCPSASINTDYIKMIRAQINEVEPAIYNISMNISSDNDPIPSYPPQYVIIIEPYNLTAHNKALVNLYTNEPANKTFSYAAIGSSPTVITNTSFQTNHSILLSGLSPNTTYIYNITRCYNGSNCRTLGPFNFTTQSACDTAWSAWSSWSACVAGQQSRTRNRLCYNLSEEIDSETQSCYSGGGGTAGSYVPPVNDTEDDQGEDDDDQGEDENLWTTIGIDEEEEEEIPEVTVTNQSYEVFTPINDSIGIVWENMTDDESVGIAINSTEMGVNEIIFRVRNRKTVQAKLTIKVMNNEVPDVVRENIEQNMQKKIYKYLEINKTNIGDEEIDGLITIKFQVEKQWLQENNVSENEVSLWRHNGTAWTQLLTWKTGENNVFIFYEASCPSFSIFAIGEKQTVEVGDQPFIFDWIPILTLFAIFVFGSAILIVFNYSRQKRMEEDIIRDKPPLRTVIKVKESAKPKTSVSQVPKFQPKPPPPIPPPSNKPIKINVKPSKPKPPTAISQLAEQVVKQTSSPPELPEIPKRMHEDINQNQILDAAKKRKVEKDKQDVMKRIGME